MVLVQCANHESKKSSVVLQELEKESVGRGQLKRDEKHMNAEEGRHISVKQKLPEPRFSETVYTQMMEKHGVVKPRRSNSSIPHRRRRRFLW
jgi:hypothetical protein